MPPSVSVRLAGGPGDGLKALRVTITKVELEGQAGWIRVSEPNQSVDLLAHPDGGMESLSAAAGLLLSGPYSRVRVGFGATASATLGDGTQVTVITPESVVVEAPLSFTSPQVELVILVDPGRSLQRREGAYLLRPMVQVLDVRSLGRIQGRLTAGGSGLGGVIVMGQSFAELGVPRLLQRVVTASDGSYVLGILPKGLPLHVVSQPLSASASFDPQASPSLTLGEAPQEWSATFTHRPTLASFRGEYHAPALFNQSGEVHLLGPVQGGTEVKLFTLRMVSTTVDGGVEFHRMGMIPSGSYVLRGYRATWLPDGAVVTRGQNSVDLGLVSDFETRVDFLW